MKHASRRMDSLSLYLRDIKECTRLLPEVEKALWKRLKEDPDDLEASTKLAKGYIHIPIYMAKKFVNRGIDFNDLIQEGNLGLVQAIRWYRQDRGAKFITFCYMVIRQHIYSALADHGKLIRLPLRLQKEVWNTPEGEQMSEDALEVYCKFKLKTIDAKDENDDSLSNHIEDERWSAPFDELDTQRHAEHIKTGLYRFLVKENLSSKDLLLACLVYGLNGEEEHTITDASFLAGYQKANGWIRYKKLERKVRSFKWNWVRYSN